MTKAVKIEDTKTVVLRHKVGDVEIGITRVMFGYRVRAGRINRNDTESYYYHCDWCCGLSCVHMSLAINFIIGWLESSNKLEDLPTHSEVKPFYHDDEFRKRLLTDLRPPKEPVNIDVKALQSAYQQLLESTPIRLPGMDNALQITSHERHDLSGKA